MIWTILMETKLLPIYIYYKNKEKCHYIISEPLLKEFEKKEYSLFKNYTIIQRNKEIKKLN